MKIVRVFNDAASCNVLISRYTEDCKQDAINCTITCEYFSEEDDISADVLPMNYHLAIVFDGNVITHTVEEWCDIYDGITSKPVIISQSEY